MSNFKEKLATYLAAGFPALCIESPEEARIIMEVCQALKAAGSKRIIYRFDLIGGLMTFLPDGKMENVNNMPPMPSFGDALKHFLSTNKPGLLLLLDPHHSLEDQHFLRHLRSSLNELKASGKTVVLVAPKMELPVDWQHEVTAVSFAMPCKEELRRVFRTIYDITDLEKSEVVYPEPDMEDKIARAASGLTTVEAENVFAVSFIRKQREQPKLTLDTDYARMVFDEKVNQIKQHFFDYVPPSNGFATIGGLQNLKDWSLQRAVGFSEAARQIHLPFPKGVLLTGVRGCGKTVTAEAIAYELGFPLFKLDLGRLFGGIIGETERNTRHMLALLESIGEAVVLLDEIDKYLSNSAVGGKGDSGTSSRMFGTLLSWMASKTVPVFLVATANNLTNLPPELLRKGRFDEIFFVDAPGESERLEIFTSLLSLRYKQELPAKEELRKLAANTVDYTGADIDAVIQDALYRVLNGKLTLVYALTQAVEAQRKSVEAQADYLSQMREGPGKTYRPANAAVTNPLNARKIHV